RHAADARARSHLCGQTSWEAARQAAGPAVVASQCAHGLSQQSVAIEYLMTTMNSVDALRYPVGPMPRNSAPLDPQTREQYFGILEAMPSKVRSLVNGLTDAQLDTPYRPGGWTVRQVVHHVPDSHMNAY